MKAKAIIDQLAQNENIFREMLTDISAEEYNWRYADGKWNLLEIVCHLFDEEREDFRARLLHTLNKPEEPMPPINPPGWVNERRYAEKNYAEVLSSFLQERKNSIGQLQALVNPDWETAHLHPKFGEMSAGMFLANWLAHDHLHFRQIIHTRYEYLKQHCGRRMDYAGDW